MSFADEVDAYVAANGQPDRFELMLCDIGGILRGKWLPGDAAAKLMGGSVRLPLSTYVPNILGEEVNATGLGSDVGDPDGTLVPVPGTLTSVPWAEGNAAQVLVEMTDEDGDVAFVSSREALRRVLDRFAARGLTPIVATELEFYITELRESPDDPPTPPAMAPLAQNYDLEVMDRSAGILDAIRAASDALGLPTDTLIAEYGPGQFEINFHHTDDALYAAEIALMFRRLVRGTVAAHGMDATFMAKPYAEHPGNGMHAHVSVLDREGRNIFDHEGEGPSETLRHATAGVLSTMRDLQPIFAPHLNSCRRFAPGSFSPSAPDWGVDNRLAGVRLPEVNGPAARLEHRICGADVNPYLALAAILGGVLHGLEQGIEPPLALDDDAAEPAVPLSTDWAGSIERFATSEIAAEIFTPEMRDVFTAVKRDEVVQIASQITQVEYRAYLSRF